MTSGLGCAGRLSPFRSFHIFLTGRPTAPCQRGRVLFRSTIAPDFDLGMAAKVDIAQVGEGLGGGFWLCADVALLMRFYGRGSRRLYLDPSLSCFRRGRSFQEQDC